MLYRCIPEQILEKVTELCTEDVELYNLHLIGEPIHIVSQGDHFACYYPEKISFPTSEKDQAVFMNDGRIYFESWSEEGWDAENNCAGDAYDFHYMTIIRDYSGNTLSSDIGSIYQAADGTWWIA